MNPLFNGSDYLPVKAMRPTVEVEEDLYSYVSPNNGSGPMWCKGSTCILRSGEKVVASGIETFSEVSGLSKCKWTLFSKDGDREWVEEAKDPGLTREPSPLARFENGQVLLSANPKIPSTCEDYCPTHPEIFVFDENKLNKPSSKIDPWRPEVKGFMDHSYRSFSSDPISKEVIIFQNDGYEEAKWSCVGEKGKMISDGIIKWPSEVYEGKDTPLRLCYHNVALKDRKVFIFTNADIVEPVENWRNHKKELTGREWDYVFRRLFFTWCDDITTGVFHPWRELGNRDEYAGATNNNDLWLAPDGKVHLLWTDREIDTRLREKFFPHKKQMIALRYMVLEKGEVLIDKKLHTHQEGDQNGIPGLGRFQATGDGRLFVVYHVENADGISENRVLEILDDANTSASALLPLQTPFTNFFTATERSGSMPSQFMDMLGNQRGKDNVVSYARVKLY